MKKYLVASLISLGSKESAVALNTNRKLIILRFLDFLRVVLDELERIFGNLKAIMTTRTKLRLNLRYFFYFCHVSRIKRTSWFLARIRLLFVSRFVHFRTRSSGRCSRFWRPTRTGRLLLLSPHGSDDRHSIWQQDSKLFTNKDIFLGFGNSWHRRIANSKSSP